MKTRQCFVSNSSSSSFVCMVCGGVESGYNGEYNCENIECGECGGFAHIRCLSPGYEVTKEVNWSPRLLKMEFCPDCMDLEKQKNGEKITDETFVLFLKKFYKIDSSISSSEELEKDIRNKCKIHIMENGLDSITKKQDRSCRWQP